MKSNNNKKNRQINTMFQRKQGGDREYLETLLNIRGDLSEKLTCEIRITHTHIHTPHSHWKRRWRTREERA